MLNVASVTLLFALGGAPEEDPVAPASLARPPEPEVTTLPRQPGRRMRIAGGVLLGASGLFVLGALIATAVIPPSGNLPFQWIYGGPPALALAATGIPLLVVGSRRQWSLATASTVRGDIARLELRLRGPGVALAF